MPRRRSRLVRSFALAVVQKVEWPACLVTLQPHVPDDDYDLRYICPKPLCTAEDDAVIAIEQQDTHEVSAAEGVCKPLIWTILLLGQRRDAELIDRLSRATTFRKLKAKSKEEAAEGQVLLTREGIIRGSSDQREERQIVDRRILEQPGFPEPDSMTLDADKLNVNRDPSVNRKASSDFGV